MGADLPQAVSGDAAPPLTVVSLAEDGAIAGVHQFATLPELTAIVRELAGGEPFALAVNLPIVVPPKASRSRPVENLIRRRFGFTLPPGGRGSMTDGGTVVGESLMMALAAAGEPCLPYPDRNRLRSCLVECHARLALKVLAWEQSPLANAGDGAAREEWFRAYELPTYRGRMPARSSWRHRAANLDICLRLVEARSDLDLTAARRQLMAAGNGAELEQAAGVFEATLLAATARRYLEDPASCIFLGDHEQGYVIVPAESIVRRLARSTGGHTVGQLFPKASLRDRLGPHAALRPTDLLPVAGRPQRTEARFHEPPRYEFDNLDEMLWWKHCRHLGGPSLPVEGLHELVVQLDALPDSQVPLRLQRSRHQTLSFRFEPTGAWRVHIPTRDGRIYPFRVLRAVYDTLPGDA